MSEERLCEGDCGRPVAGKSWNSKWCASGTCKTRAKEAKRGPRRVRSTQGVERVEKSLDPTPHPEADRFVIVGDTLLSYKNNLLIGKARLLSEQMPMGVCIESPMWQMEEIDDSGLEFTD